MIITNITTKRVAENKWLVWFASCTIDNAIKLNNIAIFKRLWKETYRLVFPEKKVWENKIQIFFPISEMAYRILEEEITKNFK